MTRNADQLHLTIANNPCMLACEDTATSITIATLDSYLSPDKCCLAMVDMSYAEAFKLASWLIARVQRAEGHRLNAERAA